MVSEALCNANTGGTWRLARETNLMLLQLHLAWSLHNRVMATKWNVGLGM
jgi:hypothetical protein